MDGFFFGKALMAAALIALVIDAVGGEPSWLWSRIGHPVVWLGNFAGFVERRLNHGTVQGGVFGWILVVGLATGGGIVLQMLLLQWDYGWLILGLVGSVGLAARSLDQHVRAVAQGLDKGVEEGRRAVALIVGRDPHSLDEYGVGRAAVESLAENASDGFVAPLFWFLLLGLPGLFAYKAINTLDSMWGYRNDRFEAFGKPAALIDDAANWVPARLSAFLISLTAGTTYPLLTAVRDASKHRSPNAGWPEAAFASALNLSLAGPRAYDGRMSADAPMGTGTRKVTSAHIRAALKLFWYMWAVILILCCLIGVVVWL